VGLCGSASPQVRRNPRNCLVSLDRIGFRYASVLMRSKQRSGGYSSFSRCECQRAGARKRAVRGPNRSSQIAGRCADLANGLAVDRRKLGGAACGWGVGGGGGGGGCVGTAGGYGLIGS